MGACGYCRRDFTSKIQFSVIKVVWVIDTIRWAAHLPPETYLALESRAGHGQGTGGKESFERAEAEKKACRLSGNVLEREMSRKLT